MVLAGAFLGNFVCSLYAIVGLFNVVFLEVFRQSAAVTAWLIGLHSALVSLIGKWGERERKRVGHRK